MCGYDPEEPCFVSPSPELLERLIAERELESGNGPLPPLFPPRGPARMNDGMIYPPDDTLESGTVPQPPPTPQSIVANPMSGTKRIVVVLCNFADRRIATARSHFDTLFFSSGTMPTGSVNDYFREVSGGKVTITGDIFGPYDLPQTTAYYANGEKGIGNVLPNSRTMADDAFAAGAGDIDFSAYDNDGDGYVDAFVVVHAGPGAEKTGAASDIWSHKWVLPATRDKDGRRVYAYLTVPEDSDIGVVCHELGHLLFRLPDLYDTDKSSNGVGDWCLMGSGS